MRTLAFLAAASLGLGVTAFQPSSYAVEVAKGDKGDPKYQYCVDPACLRDCTSWQNKASRWRDTYIRRTNIYIKGYDISNPNMCKALCTKRIDMPSPEGAQKCR